MLLLIKYCGDSAEPTPTGLHAEEINLRYPELYVRLRRENGNVGQRRDLLL
jgi:hypothetical protein